MAARSLVAPVAALGLSAMILFASCGGASEPQIDDANFDQDVVLIRDLWAGFSQAWQDGREVGYAFIAAHNHPALECSEPDFDAYRDVLPPSMRWEVTLDEGSLQLDSSWRIRDSASRSVTPDGRIYRHNSTNTYSGDFPTETTASESHSGILKGAAVFFFPCR